MTKTFAIAQVGGIILSAMYYAIPHLELFDVRDLIIHNWPSIPWTIWSIAVAYALIYAALLVLGAWLVFRQKSLQ